jgi:uncharacterized cupin superfamily protein
VRRVNAFAAEVEYRSDRPAGYAAGFAELGPGLGASEVGVSVCELPPGESSYPYHYEYGNEEWLIVLAGRPTLRHPVGEDELEPGDVVLFPIGPEGAHKLTNRGDALARVLFLSTKRQPGVAVYPDSDKIGLWPEDASDEIIVRRESGVAYWDGER